MACERQKLGYTIGRVRAQNDRPRSVQSLDPCTLDVPHNLANSVIMNLPKMQISGPSRFVRTNTNTADFNFTSGKRGTEKLNGQFSQPKFHSPVATNKATITV